MQRIFAEYLQIFFFYDIFAYNMALINPFKHLEHKVYNRTFMRNASADIEYAEVSLSANAGAISKFLQDNFNTGLNSLNNNQFEAIKVSANERQLSYNFSKTHASVIIGARDYESFASSMQPCIGKLTQFLNVVGTPKVTKVTLRKQNVWEISSENARNSYKAATWYIFADEKIREVAKVKIPDGQDNFKLSREATVGLGDGALVVDFQVEQIDERKLMFTLDLKAFATNVDFTNILETSSILNNVIYAAFHDLVTADIIKLMEKMQ